MKEKNPFSENVSGGTEEPVGGESVGSARERELSAFSRELEFCDNTRERSPPIAAVCDAADAAEVEVGRGQAARLITR